MTAVLPLQQHPTLLRTFASILAEGVADAKPCDNTEEVFKTLTGGIYVGCGAWGCSALDVRH